MVWGLFRVDPLPGDQNYYFFKTGSYKVGRKGCDVIVNEVKRVSKIHAKILIDEMVSDHLLKKPSSFLSKVRIKDCSKNGTFINKNLGSTTKVHEFPNKETMLKDGDLVSFGTGNATYRFSYVPFIFFICSPKNSRKNQLITKKVSSIGANITKRWSLDCSHVLVDDSFPLSDVLIVAILARKPLVQFSWVELIAGKNVCTDIPSCNFHGPNLMLEGVSVKVVDPQSRECFLKGYVFVFVYPENQYKFEGRLKYLLEVAGAKVSSTGRALEKNAECPNMVCVVPAGSSSKTDNMSLPSVREIDLVCAVLSGSLDLSLITPPSDGNRVIDHFNLPHPDRWGLGYNPDEGRQLLVLVDRSPLEENDLQCLNSLLDKLCSSDVSSQKKAAKSVRRLIKQRPPLLRVFGVCSDAVTKLLNPLSANVKTHPHLQEYLIRTVLDISIHDSNKNPVAQNPVVIPLLVESLKFGTLKTRINSAIALSNLSTLYSNKDIIVKAGALKPLVDLLDEGEVFAMNAAASAIFNLSVVPKNQGKAVSEGAIKAIMKKLKYRVLVDELLAILALLSSHPHAIEEMGELGAVSCLLSILKEDTSDQNKENCIVILYTVCYNDRTKLMEMWIHECTSGTISNLAESGTSRAKSKANGILEWLNRCLY